jgi:hypothetical protein
MQRQRILTLSAIVTIIAGAARASPFDGKWVDDLDTQMNAAHADIYLVADGTYRCGSCTPQRAYPADGRPKSVPGDPDTISESVSITGPRTIVTRNVGQRMVRETTMTVSADDQTATYVALDRWPGLSAPLRTEYLARRIAPAPPGAHPVSGSWLGLRYVEVPEEYRSIELRETGDQLTRYSFRRGRYTATYGGGAAPIRDAELEGLSATVRKPDDRTIIETVLVDGKPTTERTYRLSADGRSMETAVKNLANGEVFRITSHRR